MLFDRYGHQKTTRFSLNSTAWTPEGTHGSDIVGNGRCPHPRSYRHPQCMSGSDRKRRVSVANLADSYVKYRIPGAVFAEMLTDMGVLSDDCWVHDPEAGIGGM